MNLAKIVPKTLTKGSRNKSTLSHRVFLTQNESPSARQKHAISYVTKKDPDLQTLLDRQSEGY